MAQKSLASKIRRPGHTSHLLMFSFEVVQALSAIAGELSLVVPATIVGVNDFDASRLDWGRLPCRWFPGVSGIEDGQIQR
jgi:hypothetical protein